MSEPTPQSEKTNNQEESHSDSELNIELKNIAAESRRREKALDQYVSQIDDQSSYEDAESKRSAEAKENHGRPKPKVYQTDKGSEVTVIGSVNSTVDSSGEVEIHAGHPKKINAPVVDVIRERVDRAIERKSEGRKVTVIYEGSYVPDSEVSEEEAMEKGSESALLAKLAREAGLDIISGEPSTEELQEGFDERKSDLEKLGITEDTILAQRILSGLHSAVISDSDLADFIYQRAAEVGIEGFDNPTEEEKEKIVEKGEAAVQEYLKQQREKALSLVARLNTTIQSETGQEEILVVGQNGEIVLGPTMPRPTHTETIDSQSHDALYSHIHAMIETGKFRTVREIKSEIRDKVIFERVAEASQDGDVLIVYGGSHISSLEPVFDSYYNS